MWVYEVDGRVVKEIPLQGRQHDAAVLTTVPYGERGFVAVRRASLSVCRGGITRPAVVHTLAGRYRADRGTSPFVNLVDVAVDRRRGHLLVLDAASAAAPRHRTAVYVMTEDGAVVRVIRPGRDPRCGALDRPFAVDVDRGGGGVLVADGGRVVRFGVDDARYLSTPVGDHDSQSRPDRGHVASERGHSGVEVRGIAVGGVAGEQTLFAVLAGDRFAQVRVFALPP